MDREDRWDFYTKENLEAEKRKIDIINPLVETFANICSHENSRRILDLGCGLGRHTNYLVRRGFIVSGFDISREAIQAASEIAIEKRIHPEYVQGDYVDLPFTNSSFDSVLSIDTIHHDFLENIISTFSEVHRILIPRGLFCFNLLSSGDGLLGKGRKLGEKLYVIDHIPHYFFDEREIRSLVERTFFRIESIEIEKYRKDKGGETIIREKFNVITRRISSRHGKIKHYKRT